MFDERSAIGHTTDQRVVTIWLSIDRQPWAIGGDLKAGVANRFMRCITFTHNPPMPYLTKRLPP